MITIDGSAGEGGGQILRSSLALSLVTGQGFRIQNIRAGRPKPGLLRQHLTAVEAATQVGNAAVDGATLGSTELLFKPGKVRPGEYRFAVGTAGSATLVFQTVLPALMMADAPSRLTLEGGTHNPYAPPFDFLQRAFVPIVNRMGCEISVKLERHGFFPAGGGRFVASIQPVAALKPFVLEERGPAKGRMARALLAHLSENIGNRELKLVGEKLGWGAECLLVESVDANSPGNALLLELQYENVTELFTGFGDRGVTAERVASNAVQEARDYLISEAPVGEYLADQLLLPMALAGGGSFVASGLSRHTLTNMEVIAKFLPVQFVTEAKGRGYRISVGPK